MAKTKAKLDPLRDAQTPERALCRDEIIAAGWTRLETDEHSNTWDFGGDTRIVTRQAVEKWREPWKPESCIAIRREPEFLLLFSCYTYCHVRCTDVGNFSDAELRVLPRYFGCGVIKSLPNGAAGAAEAKEAGVIYTLVHRLRTARVAYAGGYADADSLPSGLVAAMRESPLGKALLEGAHGPTAFDD